VRYCPTDVMWADVLTKPLQGQKFRGMRAFLQNRSRSYDDNIELQTDELARISLKPQVKTVASLRECVGERTKSTREKKGRNKSVSWGGETQAVSHEKTSLEGILKAKPRSQTTWTKDMRGTRMRAIK
jgi:hypothetical protein